MNAVGRLNTKANISGCDDVYEALIKAHSGKTLQESAKYNAKLILLLANHIGDERVVLEAIKKAG